MKLGTSEKGRLAEDTALAFLKKEGLVMQTRNYRCRRGEIDLVMRDGETTVFVEVRSRTRNSILNTIETIDQNKQRKIILTSQSYMQEHNTDHSRYYRFDVVLINGNIDQLNIEWIKNAFDA